MGRDKAPQRNDVAVAGTILALGVLLVLAGQFLTDRGHAGGPPALDVEQLLGFTANVLGLVIVAWWLLTFVLAFLAAALQRSGRRSRARVVAKYSPGFMLRLTFALLSVNLLGVAAAHSATPPDPGWQPGSSRTTAHGAAEWQCSGGQTAPQWMPRPPVVEPGLLSRSASRDASGTPGKAGVVVKDGDTLWTIAARRSGPLATDVDVAREWPRWYAANRSTIGDDPAVLHPGQVLQPPPMD
ncbi:LysM peptidoglycan-binding domain-containing protein [Paenarthrobacter sp. NPDC090522]|uniref:LysM peptidoglycan-binding domain-containing protein n=1 Tax=Paenarthrobacter sp. NPDC090522 TaxID=3364383 RepID=UPI00382CA8CB